jgi:Zn-finger protein
MVGLFMAENVSKRWAERRERLVVARVLEAGLDFDSENIRAIIKEMSYAVQKESHPEDCPCYSSQPCHPNFEDFNCFFCGCPNYDFNTKDEVGFTGGCGVKNKKARYLENPYPGRDGFGEKIWDCFNCYRLHDPMGAELFLITCRERYAFLAEQLKIEVVERGFDDLKSFADYLSKEVMKRD